MSNILSDLQEQIVNIVPGGSGDPTKSQIIELSRLWNLIAGPYFDEEIALEGWKNDWVRAAKLTFIEFCCLHAAPDLHLDKSTDVPKEAYGLIVTFVAEHPGSVRGWLMLNEREILERGNLLCIEGFYHHLNRAPVMVAEDLPNLKGPTPAYGSVSADRAVEELYDL